MTDKEITDLIYKELEDLIKRITDVYPVIIEIDVEINITSNEDSKSN